MADIAELGFKSNYSDLKAANDELEKLPPRADKAERATDRFNKSVDNTNGAVRKAASGMNVLTGAVAKLAAGMIAYFSIQGLVDYADAWSDMQSRVGAAIKDMEAAPALMQRIVDIANASYSPLAQTVEIYSRNVGVLKALGLEAQQAADYTESLNHMLVITATRGERAASVQNALSKAMAVGKLQAEGLEAVLANGGRVAEALAEELGTNVNGLRAMASEGKITSGVIANALLKSLESVRVEAGEMTATVGDAFVIMNNNITAAIGQFDKMHNISATVAEGIIFLANNLDMVGTVVASVAAGLTVALLPAIVGVTAATWGFTAALLANPLTAVAVVVALLTARIITLVDEVGGLGNAFQIVQMIALDVWERIKAGASSLQMVLAGVSLKIEASFKTAFVNIASGFSDLVSSMGGVAGMLGLDATGIAAYVSSIRKEAEDFHAAADAAFDAAGKFWDRATGAGPQMDIIGQGTSWKEFNSVMGQTTETATGVAGSLTNVATAAGAANDNTKNLANDGMKALEEAARKQREEWDFYKSTFSGFWSTFRSDLMAGTSLWDSFKNAASRALDSIANRLLDMASNSLFNMLFGGFQTILGGAAIPTGGFIPGLTGPKLFAEGGYTGNGGVGQAAGIVHGKEFVMNAAATQAIGVGTLQAINDNHVLPSNDNGGFTYQDNRSYDFSGTGLTAEEIREILAQDRDELIASLPDAIQSIQNDPRKRVVKAA